MFWDCSFLRNFLCLQCERPRHADTADGMTSIQTTTQSYLATLPSIHSGFALYCTLLSQPSPTAASLCCTFSSLPFLTTWRTRGGFTPSPAPLHSSTPLLPSAPFAGNSIMLCSRCKGEVSATGVASPYLINEVISTLRGGREDGWLADRVGWLSYKPPNPPTLSLTWVLPSILLVVSKILTRESPLLDIHDWCLADAVHSA